MPSTFHLGQLMVAVVLSMGIAAVAMTVTRSAIFGPMRDAIEKRSEWFGELFSCQYCFSHWLSFAAVAWFRPLPVTSGNLLIDLGVSAFVLVTLASWGCGLISRSFE